MTQKDSGDIVKNLIQKTILGIEGVARVSVERIADGFHVYAISEPGVVAETLREEIHSTVAKNLPNLQGYVSISIESEESKSSVNMSKSRIELAGVVISSDRKGRFSITVKLCRPDKQSAEVKKEGVYVTENVIRLAAEATLETALSFFPENSDGAVVCTKHLAMSDKNLVVVLLTLVLKEGEVSASGSACIKNETHIAAAMATLKAINRYLEFYIKD